MSEPLPDVSSWLHDFLGTTKPRSSGASGSTNASPDALPDVSSWVHDLLGTKSPGSLSAAASGKTLAAAGVASTPTPGLAPPAAPTPGGPLEPGNIDLYNRPRVQNPDGTVSTVLSTSFGTDDGEVLVPRISDDGRVLSEKQAQENYRKTGKHLGIFRTPEEATAYAKRLHDEYAAGKYDPADMQVGRAASTLFPGTAGLGVAMPRLQPPAVDAMYANINQPVGGASSNAPTFDPRMPAMPKGALPRGQEEAMLGAIGETGIRGNVASSILSMGPGITETAAKVNRMGGHLAALPLEVTGEVAQFLDELDLGDKGVPQKPTVGEALSATGDKFQRWIDSLTVPAQRAAAEKTSMLTPSSEAGMTAKLIHGAIAGAPIMAAGMGATALGGPGAGAAVFGTSGAATTYTEAIDRGVPKSQAGSAAVARGILEGILAKGLPAEEAVGAVTKAAKQAAEAKMTFAPALHGAATMAGFESLQQYGEVLTGRKLTPQESAERLTSAMLTGLAFHGADIFKAARNEFDMARLSTGLGGGTGREWQGPTADLEPKKQLYSPEKQALINILGARRLSVEPEDRFHRTPDETPGALTEEVANGDQAPTDSEGAQTPNQDDQAQGEGGRQLLTPAAEPTVTIEPKAPDALAPSLHTEGIAEALGNAGGDVVVPHDATPEQLQAAVKELSDRLRAASKNKPPVVPAPDADASLEPLSEADQRELDRRVEVTRAARQARGAEMRPEEVQSTEGPLARARRAGDLAAAELKAARTGPYGPELPATPEGKRRIITLPRSMLHLRPREMQYKDTINDRGETGEYADQKKFNFKQAPPLMVWFDPVAKEWVVADGHQRVGIYDRDPTATAGLRAEVIDAPDAMTARGEAAIVNMTRGTGTVWDAAKAINDFGWTRERFEESNIPMKGALLRNAFDLAALAPEVRDLARTGKISEEAGIAIGRAIPGEENYPHQRAVAELAAKAEAKENPLKLHEVTTLSRIAKSSGTTETVQEGLPGFNVGPTLESHLGGTTDAYKALDQIFSSAAGETAVLARKGVATRAEGEQIGKIDTEKGKVAAAKAAGDAELWNRFRDEPRYRKIVADAAERVKNGDTKEAAYRDAAAKVREQLRADLAGTGRLEADGGAAEGDSRATGAGTEGQPSEEQRRARAAEEQRQLEEQGQESMWDEPAKPAEPEPPPETEPTPPKVPPKAKRGQSGDGKTRADSADASVGTTLEDRQVLFDKTWAEKLPPEVRAQLLKMAKLMHPDKARTEAEKVRHTAFMSLTNDAADRHNTGHMQAILDAWHRGDERPPSLADYRAGRPAGQAPPKQPPPPPKQPGAPPPPKQPPPPRGSERKAAPPPEPPERPHRSVDTEPRKTALELPELVELSERIAKGRGDPHFARIITKMQRGVRGTFNDLTKEIRIRADLFRDPVQVAKTLAHEIGHYIDSIPENLKRGNILGSLASLKKYGKSLIDELPTKNSGVFTPAERLQWMKEARKANPRDPAAAKAAYAAKLQAEMNDRRLVDRETVQRELVDLSKRWRGDFGANDKYRNNPRELYADAFSALINDPELLKARAPTFHSLFFNHLDAKPGVRDAYEALQERAGASQDDLAEHRAGRALEMAGEGGERRADQIQAASQPEEITKEKVVGGLARAFIDKGRLLYRWRTMLTKAGGTGLAAAKRAINALEARAFRDAKQVALAARIDEQVVEPMLKPFEGKQEEAVNALGAYMALRRAAHERAHLANPLGVGGKFAGEGDGGAMSGLRRRLGAEKYQAVVEAADKYWELREPLVQQFLAQNTEAPEIAEKMRNNKEYARYQILRAIESAIQDGGARADSLGLLDFHKQKGTLDRIGNAFIETVLTDMALVSSAAHAESVNSVRALLNEHFPSLTLPAETGPGGRLRAGSAPAGYGMLRFREGGKVQGVYVPAELVDMFKSAPEDLNQALRMWDKAVQTPLRALLVTHNPWWAFWNTHKDIRTNAKNVYKGHFSLIRASRDFAKASWEIQRAHGKHIPDELRGMDMGAILPRHRRAWTESDPADAWGSLTATRGLLGPAADSVGVLRRGLRWTNRKLQHLGEVTERAGKVAALRESERQGLSPEEVAYNVRNLSGTPNTRRAGTHGRLTNAIYLFSGVSKEGIRASYEVARRDPVSWGLKTLLYDIAPKAAMAAAARGLFGVTQDQRDYWKKVMDGIPESDKRNYICVPLGLTKNGKSMYIPLPLDHAGAAVGSVAWKVLSGQLSSGDLAELVLTNMPWGSSSLNPVVKTASMAATYASGRNPNDEYRGRPIMPDKVFRAGGWRARKELGKAAARQLGGGVIFDLSPGRTPPNAGAIEKALGYPFVGSGLGRLVRVSDYGLEEQARKVLETQRTEKDRADLAMDDIARDALSADTSANEAFGEAMDKGKLEAKDRAKFLRHYIKLRAREYSTTKDRIESGARNKAERAALAELTEPEPEPEEDQSEEE